MSGMYFELRACALVALLALAVPATVRADQTPIKLGAKGQAVVEPPSWYNVVMTTSEAFDLARSLRYQAEVIRREAAALDSTASNIMTRYGDPADRAW